MSKRQVEVAEYIKKGLTDKEIASILNISVFTVKTHLKRLYEKLEVSGRTELAGLSDDVEAIEAWEMMDTLTAATLNSQTLTLMRQTVFSYVNNYPQTPPDELLLPVHRQLRWLRQILTQPQPVAIRRQAVQLIGVLAGVAGNIAMDQHQNTQAEGYFDVAIVASKEAGDNDLIAWILATRSLVPFFSGRPKDAVKLLDRASTIAHQSSSPRRQAWIAALQARALAAVGNTTTALKQLDIARAALVAASSPEGNDFFDEPRLLGLTGGTMLLLRRTGEASRLLKNTIELRSIEDVKGRALATLDLASCRLIEGDIDEAFRLIEKSLLIAKGCIVAPIISRIQLLQANMMMVNPISAVQVKHLLREHIKEKE